MRYHRHRYSYFIRFISYHIFDRLFMLYGLLWIGVRLSRWLLLPIPLINNWLTDFLFIPVVAHIALTLTRCFVSGNYSYTYPLYYLLLAALYCSFAFEVIAPLLSSRATADTGDVIAYLAGSIFYYVVHQRADFRVKKKTTATLI